MHIEFRHLRTIKAIHEAGGWPGRRISSTSRKARSATRSRGWRIRRGSSFSCAAPSRCACRRRGCGCCGWPSRFCRRSRRWQAEFERAARRAPRGGCTSPSNATPVSNGSFPVLEAFRKHLAGCGCGHPPGPCLRRAARAAEGGGGPGRLLRPRDDLPGVEFTPLFDYEPVFVAASVHPLAQKA